MLKRIITLSFFASLVACKTIPVSPYPGKMERYSVSEVSVVDNTIYVFGGVEQPKLEPYIVNPDDDDDDDDDYERRMFNPFNTKTSDLAYAYDIDRDQWRVETKSPFPWKSTNSVAVNRDIFLFSGRSKSSYYGSHELWKYDTVRKNWSQKTSLPFLWGGLLHSCSIDKKIYFTAEGGGQSRNIIHVYNVDSDEWEQPIFINKRLGIEKMVCLDESIKVFALEYKVNSISGEVNYNSDAYSVFSEQGVFTVHYNGTTLYSDVSQERRFDNVIARLDEYLYFYVTESEVYEATIKRVNTRTSEYEVVASDLPYNFTNFLFVPTDSNQIFLFGGSPMFQNSNSRVPKDGVSEWNHKVVKGDQ